MPAPPMEIKAVLSVMGDDPAPDLLQSPAELHLGAERRLVSAPLREGPSSAAARTLGTAGAEPRARRCCTAAPCSCCDGGQRSGSGRSWASWRIAIVLRDVAVLRVPAPFGNKAELPDAAQARAVFEPLHANIYRAFDYSKEGDIYDALARSVEGEYLEQLYRQVYESLVMRDEGGAMSRVQSGRAAQLRTARHPPRRGSARTRRRGGAGASKARSSTGGTTTCACTTTMRATPCSARSRAGASPARGPGHTAQADAREPRDADSAARA
jgi:hypothetical protein